MKKLKPIDIKEVLRITRQNKGEKVYRQCKRYYELNPAEQTWCNDAYIVSVRRGLECDFIPMKDEKTGEMRPVIMTHLSIRRNDNRAIEDWREFQWIKNDICGEDCEAVEIYPKESKLVDTCNQFHLWVFEKGFTLPFGFQTRLVTDHDTVLKGSTQRKFPETRKPTDMKEGADLINGVDSILNGDDGNWDETKQKFQDGRVQFDGQPTGNA